MRRKFIEFLNNSKFTHRFLSVPSPQWCVFAVDMLIVLCASWLTLFFGTLHVDNPFPIPVRMLIIAGVYAVMMLAVAPYKSIVRLSTFEDIYRVALTVIFSTLILAIGSVALDLSHAVNYMGVWNLCVCGMICFSLMASLRLIIKFIFRLAHEHHSREKVAILGASLNSFALASTLLAEVDGHYRPVLLFNLSDKSQGSRLNGIPVRKYDPETLTDIFAEFNCSTLIFMPDQIEFMRSGAADAFLSHNIKLLMLNKIEEVDLTGEQMPSLSNHVHDIKIEDLLGRDPIVTNNSALDASLRDRTVLITGAAGSIGSEIVRQVAARAPGRIIMVDQAETPMHELQLEIEANFPDVKIVPCIADVVNRVRMTDIFDQYRPQLIYHAAAYKHVPMMENNPSEAVLTNVFGTKLMADLAMRFGATKFVMISTDKAVNPTNVMGASKRIAEIYVQSLAMTVKGNVHNPTQFITTRFGNVLGSNGSVIPLFRRQIAEGGPVTVTHRDIIRYFMTIPEACSLVLEAGCMGEGGEIFIFDMGKPVRIYDLATRMISLAGLRPNIDIQIKETGLRPGEKLYEELLNDHEQTLPTHHKKIMIAKVRTYDYEDVCSRLSDLEHLLTKRNLHDIVAQMKRLVPEFKSQNSKYMTIDQEITSEEVIHEIGVPTTHAN